MQRRIESGIVVLVGVALIAVALAAQLFTRAPAFERLTDDFRVAMTDTSIATMTEDLGGMSAMTAEIQSDVIPAIAGALGMTPGEFNAFASESFPAFTTGIEQLPGITENFTGLSQTLDQQQANFEAADAIPTKSIPATTIPWGMLAAGLIAIAAGTLMFRTRRVGCLIALVLGVALIAGPAFLSLTSKASKADDLNAALKPIMTNEQVQGAQGALVVIGDMGSEMQDQLLPALGEQMGLSAEEVGVFMQGFPVTGQMLQQFPDVQARFDGFVSLMAGNIDDYNTIEPLSLTPIVWILIIAGLLIGTGGALSFFAPVQVHRTHAVPLAH
jgi:hypothetical protein